MKNIVLFIPLFFVKITTSSAQVSFSMNAVGCSGNSFSVIANTGTNTATGYTWSSMPSGPILSTPNSSITSIMFPANGNYTINLTVAFTMGSSSAANPITISPTPTISLTQTTFTTCITNNLPSFSKPVVISASGANSYSWQPPLPPPMIPNNGQTGTVRPAVTTCYTITGYNAMCSGSAIACLTVIPRFAFNVTPANTIICNNGLSGPDVFAELIANNPSIPAFGLPATHSYSWTGDNILTTPFSATINVAPISSSTYTVEIMDSLKCVSLPVMVTVSVQNCTDIETKLIDNSFFSVYPNPTKDGLFLSIEPNPGVSISLLDFSCNILVKSISTNKITTIDVSTIPTGIYFLKIQTGNSTIYRKILKE